MCSENLSNKSPHPLWDSENNHTHRWIRLSGKRPFIAQQLMDGPQKSGKGLAASGGSGDQQVVAGIPQARLFSEHPWVIRRFRKTTG